MFGFLFRKKKPDLIDANLTNKINTIENKIDVLNMSIQPEFVFEHFETSIKQTINETINETIVELQYDEGGSGWWPTTSIKPIGT